LLIFPGRQMCKRDSLQSHERGRYFVRTEEQWDSWKFPLESQLQAYCVKRLREHPLHITIIKVVKANVNGVSDLLLCVDGKYVAIELKTGNNRPTEHQKVFLKQVLITKGIGGIAYNWGEVKAIIAKSGYAISTSGVSGGKT